MFNLMNPRAPGSFLPTRLCPPQSTRCMLICAAVLVAVSGCGKASSRQDAASSVATTASVADAALAVCDSIAIEARHRDTTASIRTVADTLISQQDDPIVYANAPEHRVCLTVARVEHYRALPASDGSQTVPAWRPGWIAIDSLMADGPDGGEQGYMRGAVKCVARVEIDGEDDADS